MKEMPLRIVAARIFEKLDLVFPLGTFGGKRKTETACHFNNGPYDGHRLRMMDQACNERLIDLQGVYGAVDKLRQRRIPGPKIVNRNRDPKIP